MDSIFFTREMASSSNVVLCSDIHVLLVDDDAATLAIVGAILRGCEYEVLTTRNPFEALEILRQKKDWFSIVVCNLHLPCMSGIELLVRIKKEFKVPVVMMSADEDMDAMTKSLELGASFFLTKPIKPKDVKDLWQHAVAGKKGRPVVVAEGNEILHPRNKRKPGPNKNNVEDHHPLDQELPATQKKKRMVWTPELHDQFVKVVKQIGLHSVPKNILKMMKVPGLTRAQVASHLQKYRLFYRKMVELNRQKRQREILRKKQIARFGSQDQLVHNPNNINIVGHLQHGTISSNDASPAPQLQLGYNYQFQGGSSDQIVSQSDQLQGFKSGDSSNADSNNYLMSNLQSNHSSNQGNLFLSNYRRPLQSQTQGYSGRSYGGCGYGGMNSLSDVFGRLEIKTNNVNPLLFHGAYSSRRQPPNPSSLLVGPNMNYNVTDENANLISFSQDNQNLGSTGTPILHWNSSSSLCNNYSGEQPWNTTTGTGSFHCNYGGRINETGNAGGATFPPPRNSNSGYFVEEEVSSSSASQFPTQPQQSYTPVSFGYPTQTSMTDETPEEEALDVDALIAYFLNLENNGSDDNNEQLLNNEMNGDNYVNQPTEMNDISTHPVTATQDYSDLSIPQSICPCYCFSSAMNVDANHESDNQSGNFSSVFH